MNIVPKKTCKVCGETKSIEEFYTHPNTKDGHLNQCITCRLQKGRQYKSHSKEILADPGEKLAVEKLKSLGIYAASGKASVWKRQDVVAWGCVRIEVKRSSLLQKGVYSFKFDSQSRNGMYSHLILLICDSGEEVTYHLFPANHPVFYRTKAKYGTEISLTGRKVGLQYKPGSRTQKNSFGLALCDEIMSEYLDRWELIEIKRQQIIQQLQSGEYEDL